MLECPAVLCASLLLSFSGWSVCLEPQRQEAERSVRETLFPGGMRFLAFDRTRNWNGRVPSTR